MKQNTNLTDSWTKKKTLNVQLHMRSLWFFDTFATFLEMPRHISLIQGYIIVKKKYGATDYMTLVSLIIIFTLHLQPITWQIW